MYVLHVNMFEYAVETLCVLCVLLNAVHDHTTEQHRAERMLCVMTTFVQPLSSTG